MEKNVMSLRQTIKRNLDWFEQSTIMEPADGRWGVAERILETAGNPETERIFTDFPAQTPHDSWCVIESRRADCNFEAVLYFALAADTLQQEKYRKIAENILDFLYFRSGLLIRADKNAPSGIWNWSHINPGAFSHWLDDNGWVAALQLVLGRRYPQWDRKYGMTGWGLKLAGELANALDRTIHHSFPGEPGIWRDPQEKWLGWLQLPHWGVPPCMALLAACAVDPQEKYAWLVRRYHQYMADHLADFNASELTYALIGATAAFKLFQDDFYWRLALAIGDRILVRMDRETGNLPSEHHEAPKGAHLVDTIYTANWALLGLQNLCRVCPKKEYAEAYAKLLRLLENIQDDGAVLQYRGSWRGMYDLQARHWGGGNCYEGGAGSVYSGWTNAPIGMAMLWAARRESMLDLFA